MIRVIFAFFLLLPASLSAQTAATVTGTVADRSGGALPGTSLTLRNTATGLTRTPAAHYGRKERPSAYRSASNRGASKVGIDTRPRTPPNGW